MHQILSPGSLERPWKVGVVITFLRKDRMCVLVDCSQNPTLHPVLPEVEPGGQRDAGCWVRFVLMTYNGTMSVTPMAQGPYHLWGREEVLGYILCFRPWMPVG